MIDRIRRELRTIRAASPGSRFEDAYERTHVRREPVRVLLIGLGTLLILAAGLTFFVPGPNFVLVLGGLVLVGGQSRTVARVLDRGEVTARSLHDDRWEPYPHKVALLVLVAAGALALLGGLGWLALERNWLPEWIDPWRG